MAHSLTRWLRREPVAAGRHVRVMPSTTVPGAAPALVATATQVVMAAESEQASRPPDEASTPLDGGEPPAPEHDHEHAHERRVPELREPDLPLPESELPESELPESELPESELPESELGESELPAAAVTGSEPRPERDAAEPVLAPVEPPHVATHVAPVAVEPPPFEPPPWDLPAPASPPVPASDPVPASSPFGVRYEPHPVALEFSDGARFELDEDDPRFESFLAAAAAVTGAHNPA